MAISPDLSSPRPPAFDPTSSVVFELAEGRVRRAQGQPVVLVAATVLAELCASLNAEQRLQLGQGLGATAAASLQAGGLNWTLPQLVEQLGGEISLSGLGAFSMERWGAALVVRIESCPLQGQGPVVMGAYIESALKALVGRDVNAVTIETSEAGFRLLLCGAPAAIKVQQWLAAGQSFGDVLASLQSTSASFSQGAN